MNAFKYGTAHGGLAYGLDRLCHLCGLGQHSRLHRLPKK